MVFLADALRELLAFLFALFHSILLNGWNLLSAASDSSVPSLDSVNDDCLHLILSHLHYEDLNSMAICSRHYRQARGDPRLDQTRSGTIVCREDSTVASVFRAVEAGGWDDVFTGNRTHLRIEGITRLTGSLATEGTARLTGVTSADLSQTPLSSIEDGERAVSLCELLPNVTELDMSYVRAWLLTINPIWETCHRITKLTWKAANRGGGVRNQVLFLTGFLQRDEVARGLTELYIDDAYLEGRRGITEMYGTDRMRHYLYMDCSRLERLSMKGQTWSYERDQQEPVPQEVIMKFVRRHQSLRWLRSDLTEENVAILKRERPDVTFVTD